MKPNLKVVKETPTPKRTVWTSARNVVRNRPLLTLTLSRPGKAALEKLAVSVNYSRGVVTEALVRWHTEALAADPAHFAKLEAMCASIANDDGSGQKK